jgi:hypothetical protein
MGHPPEGDPPAALDQRLVQALEHPVRVEFLKLLAQRGALSPGEAQSLLDGGEVALGNLVYHVRVLDYFELVAPAGEPEMGRGQPFKATATGELAIAALGLSPEAGTGETP